METLSETKRFDGKSDRLLTRILLIGGIITSQVCLTPMAAQAASSSINYYGNCGFSRPFTKAETTRDGYSTATTGWSDAVLQQYSGGTFQQVAQKSDSKGPAASATPTADAGVSGLKGRFRGFTAHKTSFWIEIKHFSVPEFTCS